VYNDNRSFNIEEYCEKLKKLNDHGKREVCILIDFMEYYESEKRGNEKCCVQNAEKM